MNQNCEFNTERLFVKDWLYKNDEAADRMDFAKKVIRILTPKVTKSLPNEWKKINTVAKANKWIFDRASESSFLSVYLESNHTLAGFIFLYESESKNQTIDLRFGYLLAESAWNKGFGTELINGLVNWCEKNGHVNSLSGGVERNNIASIKVMEKTGFSISKESKTKDDVIFFERLFH
ncbi:GNAT family N-acetyltransferase [Marinifilum sp.]|uniref:GNAT family N-acetyltransferase n=1 Tax=Marinifilum sp. TaxID=2033137 RepID=UPI003BAC6AD6